MHKTVQNLINIQNLIKSKQSVSKNDSKIPKIIAVSKTFTLNYILPLIEHGHIDYGENKVQEALEKWSNIKQNNNTQIGNVNEVVQDNVGFMRRAVNGDVVLAPFENVGRNLNQVLSQYSGSNFPSI